MPPACDLFTPKFELVAVLLTRSPFVALSGIAACHKRYVEWLERLAPRTRGQIEYFFIISAGIYLVLQSLAGRLGSPQMRSVANAFRFVIPGHVLTSLLLLGPLGTGAGRGRSACRSALLRNHSSHQRVPALRSLIITLPRLPADDDLWNARRFSPELASRLMVKAMGFLRLCTEFFPTGTQVAEHLSAIMALAPLTIQCR